MKKFLKIFAWTIVVLILLVGIIAVSVKLSENQITDFALEKVSESIEAPVQIGRVNFNIVRKFPFASIELENVWLGAADIMGVPDSTYADSDSLLFIKHIYVAVNTRSFLNSKYEIVNVELSGLELTYNVDSTGATNFDFLMTADTAVIEEEVVEVDTAPSILDVLLSDLTLTDITLNYNDESLDAYAKLHIPELNVKGTVYDTSYTGKVKGSILLTDCGFEDYNVNLMQKTYLQFDVSYENDSAFVNNIKLETDGIDFEVLGSAAIGDSIYTDLKVNLSKVDLGELIKYAPKEMLDEFGVEKVAGVISIESDIKGIYADSTMLPRVDATIRFKSGEVLTKDYPPIRNFNFNGTITNGNLQTNATTAANFPNFHFETDQSKFNFGFSVVDIDKPKYTFNTEMEINFDEFSSLIPDSTVEYLNGQMKVMFKTHGVLPDDLGINSADYFMDRTKLSVELNDFNTALDSITVVNDLTLNFEYKPRRIDITNLGLKAPGYGVSLINSHLNMKILGLVDDMDHMGADIESFKFDLGETEFKGSAYLKDLNEPTFKLNTNIKVVIEEFKSFIPDTLLNDIGGTIELALKSYGTVNLDSIENQATPIAFEQTELSLKVIDFNVQEALNDPLMTIDDFDLDFEMADDTLLINNLSVAAHDMTFKIDSTSIWNFYKTFMLEQRDSQLIVQTNIKVGQIDYNKIDVLLGLSDTTEIQESNTEMPDSINVDDLALVDSVSDEVQLVVQPLLDLGLPHFIVRGKLTVEHVTYERNELDDISLLFRFADSLYVIDQFKLNTCGGHISTSVMLEQRIDKRPRAEFKNFITGLDVKELLERNDNFGDTSITAEKVNGILTSELNGRAMFQADSIPLSKVSVKGHFTLEDGKLYDYEPLVELSKSMKVLGGLRELDKMDFNTLKTSVFLRDGELYFPETNVVSSAVDLSAMGVQSIVADDYEYHIELHLKDVVAGKSEKLMKAQKKQNKKDGSTVERNGLKLIAKDYASETKYGFDNDNARDTFANKVRKQNGRVRLAFAQLLNNYHTELDRIAARDEEKRKIEEGLNKNKDQ